MPKLIDRSKEHDADLMRTRKMLAYDYFHPSLDTGRRLVCSQGSPGSPNYQAIQPPNTESKVLANVAFAFAGCCLLDSYPVAPRFVCLG